MICKLPILIAPVLLALSACGDENQPVAALAAAQSSDATTSQSGLTVGGTVSGLHGSGLTLQLDGGATEQIAGNGTFAFPVSGGSAYDITVSVQPTNPNQSCVASNASGTVGSSSISTVSVVCTSGWAAIAVIE